MTRALGVTPSLAGLAGPTHAHSLAVPSLDPVAKVRPSGLAATAKT